MKRSDNLPENLLALAIKEPLGEDAVLLRGFALSVDEELLQQIDDITAETGAPFRQMVTPGGHTMSVAMSNCGNLGWVTDAGGYRYTREDPLSGRAWPKMPALFEQLANRAAAEAGFIEFKPDACLINKYKPGTRLTLHQDRNEACFSAPIVSVSLGLPATFLFGGSERSHKQKRIALMHGDVVVWGGASRLNYHGIAPLKEGVHPLTGSCRYNLTFRLAG